MTTRIVNVIASLVHYQIFRSGSVHTILYKAFLYSGVIYLLLESISVAGLWQSSLGSRSVIYYAVSGV